MEFTVGALVSNGDRPAGPGKDRIAAARPGDVRRAIPPILTMVDLLPPGAPPRPRRPLPT